MPSVTVALEDDGRLHLRLPVTIASLCDQPVTVGAASGRLCAMRFDGGCTEIAVALDKTWPLAVGDEDKPEALVWSTTAPLSTTETCRYRADDSLRTLQIWREANHLGPTPWGWTAAHRGGAVYGSGWAATDKEASEAAAGKPVPHQRRTPIPAPSPAPTWTDAQVEAAARVLGKERGFNYDMMSRPSQESERDIARATLDAALAAGPMPVGARPPVPDDDAAVDELAAVLRDAARKAVDRPWSAAEARAALAWMRGRRDTATVALVQKARRAWMVLQGHGHTATADIVAAALVPFADVPDEEGSRNG